MAKRKMTTEPVAVTEEVVAETPVEVVPEPVKEEKIVTVKVPKLNFRKEPDGEVIDVLVENEPLKVLDEVDEWTKVKLGRKTGYVMTKFVG